MADKKLSRATEQALAAYGTAVSNQCYQSEYGTVDGEKRARAHLTLAEQRLRRRLLQLERQVASLKRTLVMQQSENTETIGHE